MNQDVVKDSAGGVSRRSVVLGGAAGLAAAVLGPGTAAQAASSTPSAAHRSPVGFVLSHEQFRTPKLLEFAASAESAGFGTVWTSDHIQPWQENEQHAMHPWLTQALLTQATQRITFGTGVTCPTFRHHPSEVAQAFASLGILAPGRVFLGVGTGEALNEQASTGNFAKYPERAARLVEAVTLIRRLWTGEQVTFDGTFYKTDQFKLYDLPTLPVPIYIAASGPKSAYLAGRHGDGWVTSASDLMKPELRTAFEQGAQDAGRDPATMPKLAETFVVVGDVREAESAASRWRFTVDPWKKLVYVPNPVEIQREAAAMFPLPEVYAKWPVSTDPAVHIAAVQKVLDLGGTPYIHSGQHDQEAVISFYGKNVLPYLHT